MEEGGARNKLGTGQEGRAKNGSFLLGASFWELAATSKIKAGS